MLVQYQKVQAIGFPHSPRKLGLYQKPWARISWYGLVNTIQYNTLLPCLQTIRVSDRDSRTVIDRTRHVTSPIWSRTDWLTGPKIRIVGLRFAELELDKTVHLELYSPLSGRSKHKFQLNISIL